MNFVVTNKMRQLNLVLGLLLAGSGIALADSPSSGALDMADSVRTVGGLLKVDKVDDSPHCKAVLLNNKKIPDLSNLCDDLFVVTLVYKTSIAGNDVVVVSSDSGATIVDCAMTYSFLTITPQGHTTVNERAAEACDAAITSTPTSIKIISTLHDGRRTKTEVTTYTKDGVK